MTRFLAGSPVRSVAMAALTAALIVAAPAQAAPKTATPAEQAGAHAITPAQRKQIEAYKEARDELVKASSRLHQIQEAALKAHPELEKQKERFGKLIERTMKRNGYDAEKRLAELKALRDKLRDHKTSEADKQKLAQDFQHKVYELRQAQQQAMQDQKVKKARKDLGDAVIAAMKKQDPETDKLIAMVRTKEQEMEQLRDAILKQAK